MQLNSMTDTDYQIDDSLGYIVGTASRAMVNRLNRNFAEGGFDVTVEQWAILVHLWQQDGQFQQQLAICSFKDKTSITRLIDGLEKRNLVVRIPDRLDRRQKLIYLTAKGRELRGALVKIALQSLQEAQQGICPEQLAICKEVLRQVSQNLHDGENCSI